MTFSREQVHADQMARFREWSVGQGHHPDTYRKRPKPVYVKVDAR